MKIPEIITIDKSDVHAGQGQRLRSQRSKQILSQLVFPDCNSHYTDGNEMMLKTWSGIGDVPYCFSMSSIKFQGHPGWKIGEFDPNWVFPDCNSSLISQMATK